MNFLRYGRKNSKTRKLQILSLVLVVFLLALSVSAFASLRVNISFNRRTYTIGETAPLNLYFSRNVTYSIVQIEPNYERIVTNRHASKGNHSVSGRIEGPTGRKVLKVEAKDQSGNTATDTCAYKVVGGDSGGTDNFGGASNDSEQVPLSYFQSKDPSEAQNDDAARALRNQVRVIEPGDKRYKQLLQTFKARKQMLGFQNRQNLKNFNEYSMRRGLNRYQLRKELNNTGLSYLGKKGSNDVYVMQGSIILVVVPPWGPPSFIALPYFPPLPWFFSLLIFIF